MINFRESASCTALTVALYAVSLSAVPVVAQEVQPQPTPSAPTREDAAAPLAAQPQVGIADIVVTADRSTKTLQKTPIAVTVVPGSEVTAMGRTKMDDILQNVPAVIIQNAARGLKISIRGLGNDLPAQNGQATVSQNYDGVYNFRTEANVVGFYDLDRVEVLRGPQGTLYGRNASGGVVNIISADPKIGEFGGYGAIEAGNYNLLHGEAAVNVPVSDTLALRAAFAFVNREGYLSNGYNDNKSAGGRLKLLYKPSDTVSLLVGGEFSKLDGKGTDSVDIANFNSGDFLTTSDTSVGSQQFRGWKVWANLMIDAGPGVLTVLPAYQRAHGHVQAAFGGNLSDMLDPKLARQQSLEVRYAARPSEPVQWNAGYYHYDSLNSQTTVETPCQVKSATASPAVYFAPDGYTYVDPITRACRATTGAAPLKAYFMPTTTKTFTDAVFGQITYPVMDGLRLIGGARYSWDRANNQMRDPSVTDVTLPANYVRASFVDKHFEYRLGAEWDVAARSMVYATVSRGHRTGGFNLNNETFAAEKLTAYELGAKTRLFGNRLQINGDVFYYDYTNFQLAVRGTDCSSGACLLTTIFLNLPTAREFGAELESQLQLTDNDTLQASVVYLDSKLTSNNEDTSLVVATPFKGAPFPHAPRWSLKGTYSHAFDLGRSDTLTPRIDVRYLSGQFVIPVPVGTSYSADQGQKAYVSGDISLGYSPENGRWSLNAYVKNVNNKAIKSGFAAGFTSVQPPRTYGATLTAKF